MIKIAHLYPDMLNLYGDRGNIIALTKRMELRGISTQVDRITMGKSFNADDYDILFIGGGQDFEQDVLLEDLKKGKDKEIKRAVDSGKVMLAICGGYQMLGKYYKTYDGKMLEYIGALDFYTDGKEERMIGNFAYKTKEGIEGVRYKNTFGTYSHGPVLPKNPQLADLLISLAVKNKYGSCTLEPLDDDLEDKARSQVMKLYIK